MDHRINPKISVCLLFVYPLCVCEWFGLSRVVDFSVSFGTDHTDIGFSLLEK